MDPSSTADEVAEPVALVELMDLKTRAGNPFRVYVERIPEEQLVDIMRTLPGEAPAAMDVNTNDPEADAQQRETRVRRWLGWAPQLIGASSFLRMADGREVRPAFYFNDPTPGGVPGKYLTARDRTLIMNATLKLSGWTKEAAAEATFHGGDGGGSGGGADHLGEREGSGDDSVAVGARPA